MRQILCCARVLTAVVLIGIASGVANAELVLLSTQYQADQIFPEHDCFWNESQFPGPCSASAPGANVHVYLRNNGSSAVTVTDATLAGLSLETSLKEYIQDAKKHPRSIYYASLSPGDLQTLLNAGEPVWYKADPKPIPPGGSAQVVVRLRSVPVTSTVSVGVVSSAGTMSADIPVSATAPQLASVGFSSDLTKVYLYWRRSGGTPPTTILMDGTDVTASATSVSDPAASIVASILQLSQPLSPASFHVFQGVYADGKTATAGLRAWVNEFIYGTWGSMTVYPDGDRTAAHAVIDDAFNHGVNAQVKQGSSLTSFICSSDPYAANHNYRSVNEDIGQWGCANPLMWFIRDEPDWADYRVTGLPENKKIGSLAMMTVDQGEALRAADPTAPTTVNVNAYSYPYCWYNYGQVPDVFMTDPYYQVRLREAYWSYSSRIPLYQKATYIYAVAQLTNASCEPNPLHMVLYSCEQHQWEAVFPFPTPQSKRIEVYYALAGGVKGLSYWWFPAGGASNGLSAATPDALALWQEIGLLGAELKTAASLLVTSCPTTLGIQTSPSTGLWVRSLLVGTDTVILLVVNDQYSNDESGCTYTPVENASLTVSLPTWLMSPSAFEISACEVGDVSTQFNGNQLQVNLGTVNLTRMIVVTRNAQLRAPIQQLYDQVVGPSVRAMAPTACLHNIPPVITQQPLSKSICTGNNAAFNVAAVAEGTITYQWQKNGANLTDGGHYSGATTNALAISTGNSADTANYRCVASNAFGSTNSNQATLTVIPCIPGCLSNLDFEGGFTTQGPSKVGNGWTKFVKTGTEGSNTFYVYDEQSQFYNGAHSQGIFSHDNGNDGGVYQQFPSTPGQPYTLRAWFKCYSPDGTGVAEGKLGLDPTGGTDPNSPNITWVSKPYEYWSQKIWTLTAQANYFTVYLYGHSTKSPGQNKRGYVYIDDIQVAPGAPTDLAAQALSSTSIRWRWQDLAIETGYRVRDAGAADKSGALAADTTQWLEATGITPNTQYTRYIYAFNDCGESGGSTGQTAYSLIETPTDVAIGTVTQTSIVATPVGTFSNLAAGSSGVRVANTTTSTDSGWQKSLAAWTSSGLTANTPYDFVARGRNAESAETTDCDPETAWTLSVPPAAGSVTPSLTSPHLGEHINWTAVGGFGAGRIQYYRYAWDQGPTHAWTDLEPQWSGGTLTTSPTSGGTWYLHVRGYNGDDVPNGTYDYQVTASGTIAPDLDGDGDVDQADFALFDPCYSGPAVPLTPGCEDKDFDHDGDVDQSDFGIFQRCYSGTDNPADPNCASPP